METVAKVPEEAGGNNTFKLVLVCETPAGERFKSMAILRPEDWAKGPTQAFVQDWLVDLWRGVQQGTKGGGH